MSEFTLEVWIGAAPETVFAMMSDPNRAAEIMTNVTGVEMISSGPIGVGSRMRETRVVNGKPAETELIIREYQPGTRYAVTTEVSGIQVTYTYSLSPEKNGTHVHLVADVQSNGLKKLMVPIVANVMKREDGDHLIQLKHYIEAQTASPA